MAIDVGTYDFIDGDNGDKYDCTDDDNDYGMKQTLLMGDSTMRTKRWIFSKIFETIGIKSFGNIHGAKISRAKTIM